MNGPVRHRVARLLLARRMDRTEVDAVLADLDELAAGWRTRRGRVRARLSWWLELVRFWARTPRRPTSNPWEGGGAVMDGWTRDLRWAVRRMVRRPVPTAVVVLTLGLAIGAGVAAYSVLDVLVVRPLPFEDAHELVRLREEATHPGQPPRRTVMSARNFEALAEAAGPFSGVAAARYRTFTLTGDGPAARVGGIAATWNHFDVLGADPLLGRTFRPDDDRPGAAAPVVVLSHSLWTRRFGRDPGVLGRTVTVNDRAHTVVGVMPPGFRYPYAAEMWVPLGIDPAGEDYADRALNVSARLAADASVASAEQAIARRAAALREASPELNAGVDFVLTPIREEILEGVDRQAVALMWAAVFVLLIAAANVASMVLARMIVEGRETSLILALGASRRDVLRRVAAEALVLAVLASALGLALAWLGAGPLVSLSPVDDLGPYFSDIGVNWRVTAVALALAVLAAGLSVLPAALRLRGGADAPDLGTRGSVGEGRRSARTLDVLVAAEVAVAVMLLTAAGLVGRSLQEVWSADVGVETEGLLTIGMSPSTAGYADASERVAFVESALDAVRAVPGVRAAGVTNLNPFRGQGWGVGLWPEGRTSTDPQARFAFNHRAVTPGFMEAAGTRLLAGRDLTRADGASDPPVALLSEGAAREMWPDGDAVGRRVRSGSAGSGDAWVTVVGVVEEVGDAGELRGAWYRPLAQAPEEFNTAVLEIFVATDGASAPVFSAVRQSLQALDPDLPLFALEPVADILRFERRTETFSGILLGGFALLGLGLAVVGVYGVLSYSTGRRRRELGLRKALGADPASLVRDLVGPTAVVAFAGLAVGVVGAAVLTRFMGALIVGVSPLSPGVYATMAGATLLVTAAAAVPPALRALRIDPREALAED